MSDQEKDNLLRHDLKLVNAILEWGKNSVGISIDVAGLAVTYLDYNPIKNPEDAGPLTEGYFVKSSGFDTGQLMSAIDAYDEIFNWLVDAREANDAKRK